MMSQTSKLERSKSTESKIDWKCQQKKVQQFLFQNQQRGPGNQLKPIQEVRKVGKEGQIGTLLQAPLKHQSKTETLILALQNL